MSSRFLTLLLLAAVFSTGALGFLRRPLALAATFEFSASPTNSPPVAATEDPGLKSCHPPPFSCWMDDHPAVCHPCDTRDATQCTRLSNPDGYFCVPPGMGARKSAATEPSASPTDSAVVMPPATEELMPHRFCPSSELTHREDP